MDNGALRLRCKGYGSARRYPQPPNHRAEGDISTLRNEGTFELCVDTIAYKAKRNAPLKTWQKWFNKTASSVRSGGERANATMKNWYGMARVRYLGLARNDRHLQCVAMAMNMKRALVLLAG